MRRSALPMLLLLAAVAPAAAVEPSPVLFLYSYGRNFAPFDAFTDILRSELVRRSPDPLEVHETSIDIASMGAGGANEAFLAYLNALFADRSPDLVVAIGGTAATFAQTHRAGLFPEAPLLLAGVEERRIDRGALTAGDLAIPYRIDPLAAVETALAVMPAARTVLIVLGSSPLELYWREEVERDLDALSDRIALEWTTGLPFDEILRRVSALPRDAAVLYGLLLVDGDGVPLEEDRALVALTAASAAPVFGLFESQLGDGIVGGRLMPVGVMAEAAADAAVALLAGVPAERIDIVAAESRPKFDSRQLARYAISEDRLPPGSEVLFGEPSVLQRYRWQILLVAGALAVQSALIAVLLTSRRRLQLSRTALETSEERAREAAAAARGLAGRVIHAQEDERSRLGRELHDDITQRLAVLAIEAGQRERAAASQDEAATLARIREGLARLSEDVHALSYRLHPSIIEHLGLVAALESEADRISRVEGLPVAVTADGIPDDLPAPIALCLFRVAQEALRNAVRHARATQVRVTAVRDGPSLRLTIVDDGIGFVAETQRRRMSLGLDSMAERLAAVAGMLDICSVPGRGTRIEARVPLEV